MAQLTNGIRAILGNPRVYDFFQNIAGAKKFRAMYAAEYIASTGAERILDIGCGTADILRYLPSTVDYVGFDASEKYITAANARFGGRGKFFCQYINEITIKELGKFDLIMANGLIHHLNDDEVANLCRIAVKAMRPDSRMITHDPCYSDQQSRLARYVISRDRGQNVRTAEQYVVLLRPFFREVELSIRNDMAHIPYTHAIMVCRK